MIFLIDYSRAEERIVYMKTYADSELDTAQVDRLARELDHIDQYETHEIVLMEAESEKILRQTHRRYFNNFAEIGESYLKPV